jgi:hypothetical protein
LVWDFVFGYPSKKFLDGVIKVIDKFISPSEMKRFFFAAGCPSTIKWRKHKINLGFQLP